MRKKILYFVIALPFCLLTAAVAYTFPPVQSRVIWRVEDARARLRAALAPPEKINFAPATLSTAVPSLLLPTRTLFVPTQTSSSTPLPSTPQPSPSPTITPTPLPASVNLTSPTFRYYDQHNAYNYCAPANLAMALSFWGWTGSREDTGNFVKPYPKDLNVMPYEMEDYARTQASLGAITRVGGDAETIKRFIAAGFPVLVEKGVYFRDLSGVVSWMGHYEVVTGYDDAAGNFIVQDSYLTPGQNVDVPYDKFLSGWRSFNYTYLLIYSPERETEVLDLLGTQASEAGNFRYAADLASQEIYSGLEGVDLFFAWYNRGTNLVKLQDYGGASEAYDQAFALYATLPEDKSVRPYRILWYQTGPYFAYYYSGRYYDVISLADSALQAIYFQDTAPEESLYWRAMAKVALGDNTGAIEDLRLSIDPFHPGFAPSLELLNRLGAQP